MPVAVDIEERQGAIADATLRVAERAGIRGVTIRAVAEELGASTSVVTHYVPSRAQLLANAIARFSTARKLMIEAAVRGLIGPERVRTICGLMVRGSERERLYDALWIELLAQPEREPEVFESLRRHADWVHEILEHALEPCGIEDPSLAADRILLFLRGTAVSGVQDPETWGQKRTRAALDSFLEALLAPRASIDHEIGNTTWE